MPITDWLHYADHDLDPICRSSSGSYGPVTDTLVAFDQIPVGLSIGEMAEVTVQTAAHQTGLTLPNAAVKQTPQGAGVWKLRDGKPALVAIKLGSSSLDGLVQVLDGISAGDEVVVHSERALSEGARLKIVEQLAGQRK